MDDGRVVGGLVSSGVGRDAPDDASEEVPFCAVCRRAIEAIIDLYAR